MFIVGVKTLEKEQEEADLYNSKETVEIIYYKKAITPTHSFMYIFSSLIHGYCENLQLFFSFHHLLKNK